MKGKRQYIKQGDSNEKYIVREADLKFFVNFRDYLDTGLFLDHRIIRKKIASAAERMEGEPSFLNLFSYTATASVYAAKAGCRTTSVDASPRYLEWGRENFRLNRIDVDDHEFIPEGCFEWLAGNTSRYDIILLDPPTFSNTKSKRKNFDIQSHYLELLSLTLKHLKDRGVLFFSTNYRKFHPDFSRLEGYRFEDISEETIPRDFRRPIHRAYQITQEVDRLGPSPAV